MQDYTVSITPLSDDATVGLQTGCPCASGQETWGKNEQRVLTNCAVCRWGLRLPSVCISLLYFIIELLILV